jgi:putative membrane protein
MKTIIKLYAVMLLATLAVTFPACNRPNDTDTNTEKDAEKRNDAKFSRADEVDADYVVNAYADGMCEIRLAERVKDRLTTQEAKDLAQMMITDHTAMGNEMRALATKNQISLPTELTKNQQDDIDDVAEKTGLDLDRAYATKTVSMHRDAIDLFERASTKVSDPEIKAAFANALPKLRSHLDMAQTTKDHVKDMKDNNSNSMKMK